MRVLAVICSCLFLMSSHTLAENSTRVDGYTIHHNALTTDVLTPAIASRYNIQRSKSRALINISIIKDPKERIGLGQAISAKIQLKAKNLVGQTRDIPLREIREAEAIYYIADFSIADQEILRFDLEAVPNDSSYPIQAQFQQKFYTD